MKTHEIFRFLNLRPVQKATDKSIETKFVKYDKISPLHEKIRNLAGPDAREKARNFASDILSGENDLSQIIQIIEIAKKISNEAKVSKAKEIFKTQVGTEFKTWLISPESKKKQEYLWDSVYAHTLLPENKPENRDIIFNGVRVFKFFNFLSGQPDNDKPGSWDDVSLSTLIIPKEIIPINLPSSELNKEKEKIVKQLLNDWKAIKDRVDNITKAINDINNNDRYIKAKELQSGSDPELIKLGIGNRAIDIKKIQINDPTLIFSSRIAKTELASKDKSKLIKERSCFVLPKKNPWLFEKYGEKNLSKETLKLLLSLKKEVKEKEIPEVITHLEKERYELVKAFLEKLPKWICEFITRFDGLNKLLETLGIPSFRCKTVPPPDLEIIPDTGTATGRGIKPLGIGDLLIIKEELLKYTAGEVAHIENVLRTETKSRTTTQLRELEEISITETENTEESEKDLQTTERFELQKEMQKNIETEMKVGAGLSVTGSYGPVSVTAHADFALTQSSSESNKNSSTYAKENVEKSVSKIIQRVREERKIRTLERYEEKNEHGLDNKLGTGHVIGIYRWVDKYYKARLINYGKRLMMEFIVPEPAAFYLQMQELPIKGFNSKLPQEPKIYGRPLKPTDLNRWNYGDFVAAYNVQDAEEYPSDIIKVSAACGETVSQDGNAIYAKTFEKLQIPNSYKISYIYGAGWLVGVKDSDYFGQCTIGGENWGSASCNGLEGTIPLGVDGWLEAYQYNFVAVCELKNSSREAWQLKTFQSIMNAYNRAVADYNEQLAAAQVRTGIEIVGRNPELNRKLESDELKKGVLRLLTNNFAATRVNGSWRYNEHFNALHPNGEFGYPEFNIPEAIVEGKIIQFFEQSLEWNNMTYRFYSYMWGRKSEWNDIFPLNDVDPKFTDFLRAGASRVIVPVQPNYTEVLLHYLATNEIWNGGNPPTLHDPLFISIVDEIKADTSTNIDDEIDTCSIDSGFPCLVDEWEIKVPTSLVYLQEDSKLPDNSQE